MPINAESRVISQITFGKLLFAVVVITIAWLLLKWMARFFQRLETHNPRLRFLANQMQPPIRIFVWFSALLLVIDVLAPNRDAFLAVLGSAALAIGLGLQDLIKNLVGGLVIVADVPFQTGDRVQIGRAYGEVVHIGLRSTKLLTADGKIAAIPNSEILTQQTFNANRSVPEALVVTDVNVPRGLDPSMLLRIGREVAICSPYTHLGRPITVDLEDNDTRHVVMKLSVEAYVYDHRHEPAMRTDILRRAQREFRALAAVPAQEHHAAPEHHVYP
jgi:small-conductance mechanosensitive channel